MNKNTALITGASGGIGLELARIHAQKGGDLLLVARSLGKLEQVKTELEEKHQVQVNVLSEDLSQPESAERIYLYAQKHGIQVNTLINNAGFGGHGLFNERKLEDEQAMMQVNMISLTRLTHYFLQDMVKRQSGRILNVSSTASFIPGPLQAVYYATKSYVTSFSQAIAEEVAEQNVSVTALCPGAVATDFAKAGNLEDVDLWKRAKSATSVAQFGYKAMEKGKLVAINESKLAFLLNWVIPLLPRKMVLKTSRQAMEKSA